VSESIIHHGYTLTELHRLARLAAGTILVDGRGSSATEHYQTAWSAMIEHLLIHEDAPEPGQLVWVGKSAIYHAVRDDWRHWGIAKRDPSNGLGSMRAFQIYWWSQASTIPGPENRVVEREALAQIWDKLTEQQRQTLLALAATDNYQAAADLLGISYQAFKDRICVARARFKRWWHQHETPSGPWGTDRRVGSYQRESAA
jgi:hypothetical protein